jgi:L,D-transpeptidase YcbB
LQLPRRRFIANALWLADKSRYMCGVIGGFATMPGSPKWALTAACATALASVPATGQPIVNSAATSVAAAYDAYHIAPIWFHGGVENPAVGQLVNILQRAPFDGFAQGPQLASEVQAAAAQARTGNPASISAAERTLSSAWVAYVQAIKLPTQGMIYAYPVLAPQGSRADQILLTAAAASSLQTYLVSTSAVNPIYTQLRDAGWAAAQASGNLTPAPRLLANLDRVRSLPAKGRFILVDSGSSMLTLYQDGQPVDSMKAITGTRELPTPLIASVMYYITYNPYWHAPDHLVRKTIAPTVLRQGMPYLKSHGYNVIDAWSQTAKVIDLHDTPNKALFAKAERNLSNGCVRVEDAKRLGRWLLGQDPVSPGDQAETRVQTPQGTPIYLTYITAQVRDGQLSYLPDLYGWDKAPPQFASN